MQKDLLRFVKILGVLLGYRAPLNFAKQAALRRVYELLFMFKMNVMYMNEQTG